MIINDSVLPNLVSGSDSLLSNVEITGEKILHIIRSLDSKKAHGWDDLSINMIKLCDIEIVKPLYLIFMKCLETGRFPSSWKKANVLPIHKKENRQEEFPSRETRAVFLDISKAFDKVWHDGP